MKKGIVVKLIGAVFTLWGIVIFIHYADFTNGLLMMILGELVDMPKNR